MSASLLLSSADGNGYKDADLHIESAAHLGTSRQCLLRTAEDRASAT
jgi:hypothetical protein